MKPSIGSIRKEGKKINTSQGEEWTACRSMLKKKKQEWNWRIWELEGGNET